MLPETYKHIAAVYYLLAEQFDCDPFLIFRLRGRTKEQIVEALHSLRSSEIGEETEEQTDPVPIIFAGAKPLEESLDSFWQKGSTFDQLEIDLSGPKVENSVLKRLGDAPFTLEKDNLASLLTKAYGIAGHGAQQRARGETEDEEPPQ